jgi:hypothetical protein
MTKRLVTIGLGSHAALTAFVFMIVAGGLGPSMLVRASGMLALTGWVVLLVFLLLFARLKWELICSWQRAALVALALPGLTLGFPIVMLYLVRPCERAEWAGAVE